MELGFYTFGDRIADPITGEKISAKARLDQMMEMAIIADEAGLDIIGVGEHHQLDYVNSATATIIAAMAAVTKRIRFTSASTSISTADPVRTFQDGHRIAEKNQKYLVFWVDCVLSYVALNLKVC